MPSEYVSMCWCLCVCALKSPVLVKVIFISSTNSPRFHRYLLQPDNNNKCYGHGVNCYPTFCFCLSSELFLVATDTEYSPITFRYAVLETAPDWLIARQVYLPPSVTITSARKYNTVTDIIIPVLLTSYQY